MSLRSILAFSVLALCAACGDDSSTGGGGAAAGGSGPGGGGNTFTCAECAPPTDVCVDGTSCAESCPDARVACGEQGAELCCAAGQACCQGQNGGFCAASCEVPCPDGSSCSIGEMCRLDPATNSYGCTASCSMQAQCGDVCCPLGSRCEDGACPLADLSVDEPYMAASVKMEQRNFAEGNCSFEEGCVEALGDRKLLRFSLKNPNTGAGDLFLGRPEMTDDLFEYSQCHDHYHFTGYANYRLLDEDRNVVATGHKQAFCLLDYEPLSDDAPAERYDCDFQGIQAGWSDIYERSLPCQWVDVTDVAPGDYTLEVHVNFEQRLAEENYANNIGVATVTIEPDSCPMGCREDDANCCSAEDPCGRANDGYCDCNGVMNWDVEDCRSCLDCAMDTTCAGGCTLATHECCDPSNPCGFENNDVCDCEGLQSWDENDCTSCISSDTECAEVNTCPNGCTGVTSQPQCCTEANSCGYENDGYCDCSGTQDWDVADCSNCTHPDCD